MQFQYTKNWPVQQEFCRILANTPQVPFAAPHKQLRRRQFWGKMEKTEERGTAALKENLSVKERMFGSLQEAYDRLRAIVDSSYDGIYITDGSANTLWVNPAYLSISGLREEDVVGKSMWELEHSGIISRSGTLIAIAQRRPVTLEQTFRTGKRALITSTPSFGDQGDIVMVVTNVRDMTEFYDLREKYQEVEARYQTEVELARQRVLSGAELIASDPNTLAVLRQVEKVAALDTTVLLTGETGVGKEKFAQYIYKNSPRREERFITVNCGAIPPTLMESELFGYEKGAFTGAVRDKMGIFELAHKGTIFLDEIGELPLDMQVKLLRVLQERTIQRVGGERSIPIDVRVIAATNRDLGVMVKEHTFREDLFYRLNVVPITIPPLRERRGDILPFVSTFLGELNKKYGFQKQFAPSAIQAMEEYSWPGNVRELKNVVERVVILSGGDLIRASDLPFQPQWDARPALGGEPVDLKLEVARFEYHYIQQAYEAHGNVRAAAASLGMDSSTFVRKRRRCQQLLQK